MQVFSASASLAHASSVLATPGRWWLAIAVLLAIALIVEHHIVAGFGLARITRRCLAVVAVAGLAAVGAPAVSAQSAGALLPDLISDPPNPSFFNELNTADGATRLVVTFDGYVHNIGEGPLDVVGNPQEPNGMEQRVRNGDTWETVGTPTVRFETDDGHNHFHLIEAIEYVLWNEMQGVQSAIGSKVGFCLVDSELMEPGAEQAYSEELDNFCQENNPGATSLRMGISPGWRDIYDATTTLQWVDVSNVTPGRYWIGAITDPNNEVLESNESNNDLIFSTRTISVPGFSPRPQPAVTVAGEPVTVTLSASAHGTVGRPVYIIDEGPANGSLSVPVGASLVSPTFEYTPGPGFVGADQIVFSVHDATSPYPFDRPTQTLTFDVQTGSTPSDDPLDGIAPPTMFAPSTFFESPIGQEFEVAVDVVGGDGGPAAFHATGLPAGLVAEPETGVISGVPLQEGIFDVQLSATQNGLTTLQPVTFIIAPAEAAGGLRDLADQSSPRSERTRIRVGSASLGATYEADGLPPGVSLDPTSPLIEGFPSEVGSYEVAVRQLDGDQVVGEKSFVWTVRPTTAIDFVL